MLVDQTKIDSVIAAVGAPDRIADTRLDQSHWFGQTLAKSKHAWHVLRCWCRRRFKVCVTVEWLLDRCLMQTQG